ncbi:hypothetical protein D3C77_527780 [compost metagenome]
MGLVKCQVSGSHPRCALRVDDMTGGAGTSTADSVILPGFSTDYARELPAHGNPTDPEHHQGPDRALRVHSGVSLTTIKSMSA